MVLAGLAEAILQSVMPAEKITSHDTKRFTAMRCMLYIKAKELWQFRRRFDTSTGLYATSE